MHSRIAFGTSCFLLVALGAALGLNYRGGQMLSAFLLTVIPAAIVIVLLYAGKLAVGDTHVNPNVGLITIWSGNIGLVIGNAGLYGRLARR
jgi:lipopolysaccharide export LptBFGC system permease protein LptF